MAKRRREASLSGCLPEAVNVAGTLDDAVDTMSLMAKLMTMAVKGTDAESVAMVLRVMAGPGPVRIASLCSGSGIGDLAVPSLFESLDKVHGGFPPVECVFLCESEPRKAAWLANLNLTKLILKAPRSNRLD